MPCCTATVCKLASCQSSGLRRMAYESFAAEFADLMLPVKLRRR
jgi:hypothetical protein